MICCSAHGARSTNELSDRMERTIHVAQPVARMPSRTVRAALTEEKKVEQRGAGGLWIVNEQPRPSAGRAPTEAMELGAVCCGSSVDMHDVCPGSSSSTKLCPEDTEQCHAQNHSFLTRHGTPVPRGAGTREYDTTAIASATRVQPRSDA